MYEKYQEDIHFITINVRDQKEKGEEIITENAYTFQVVYDEERMITDLYRVQPIPMNYFIDKDGMIKKKVLGKMTEDELENHLLWLFE